MQCNLNWRLFYLIRDISIMTHLYVQFEIKLIPWGFWGVKIRRAYPSLCNGTTTHPLRSFLLILFVWGDVSGKTAATYLAKLRRRNSAYFPSFFKFFKFFKFFNLLTSRPSLVRTCHVVPLFMKSNVHNEASNQKCSSLGLWVHNFCYFATYVKASESTVHVQYIINAALLNLFAIKTSTFRRA